MFISVCIYLPVAVIKKKRPEAIHGRQFILAYSYKGTRLHHCWEAWQQATHMRTGAGS